MRAQESYVWKNISASQAEVNLAGGLYAFFANAGITLSSSNHIDITFLSPDGSTAIVALAGAQSGSSFYATGYLPPGRYALTVSGTVTGIYGAIVRVPIE